MGSSETFPSGICLTFLPSHSACHTWLSHWFNFMTVYFAPLLITLKTSAIHPTSSILHPPQKASPPVMRSHLLPPPWPSCSQAAAARPRPPPWPSRSSPAGTTVAAMIVVTLTMSPHGYSWFDGLLRNPRSGVQTPLVLGYSGMRVALILGRGFKPLRGGVILRVWGLGSHMSNQGTHWRRFPAHGTVGWRVASRTLSQGFKPLRGSAVGGWGPTCPIRVHLSVEEPGTTQRKRSTSQSWSKNHPTLTG
jgi:hypothetical protein